jgi:CubicO group peptidase (beta-lactamase class C family)
VSELAERLAQIVDAAAGEGFSGAVRVTVGGELVHESVTGMADRAHRIPLTLDTRLALASGAKSFTALAVLALVERGELALDTPARALLGSDVPALDDGVTVEHLLAHRSGFADYLDEEALDDMRDYVLSVPTHRLAVPDDYLVLMDGLGMRSAPGAEFVYNNGGYVLLAVLAERAAATPYHDLVDELVCRPAGMTATGFPFSDEPTADVATGYLDAEGLRTNVLHLPRRGLGDGGVASTPADVDRLWRALFDAAVVSNEMVTRMTTAQGFEDDGDGYGWGCSVVDAGATIGFGGYDPGISFASRHTPATGTTWTVISNHTDGAWPVVRAIRAALAP